MTNNFWELLLVVFASGCFLLGYIIMGIIPMDADVSILLIAHRHDQHGRVVFIQTKDQGVEGQPEVLRHRVLKNRKED